jgi:hypothetical protein
MSFDIKLQIAVEPPAIGERTLGEEKPRRARVTLERDWNRMRRT